ncbi:MAG: hypothetical protein KKH97_02235 [Proteobacteria bacterium]|nr:hypothetical protein [Pseudomonadota bacterium]MBU1713066.1 hypothetical protein [Pseudomonadota bacterium]
MNNFYPKQIVYILSVLALFMLASCANIPLKTIPPPSPTAKLRIYVQPLTGQGRWDTPHEEYVEKTIRRVEKLLDETGIYEVATKSDIRAVLGDHDPAKWEMERNGLAFARDIGKALHADYVMIIERSKERSSLGGADFYFIIKILNSETGKIFEAWSMTDRLDRSNNSRQKEIVMATYRDAFFSAKLDMLETAIKKSRSSSLQDKNIASIQPSAEVSAKAEPKPQLTAPEVKKPEPLLPDETIGTSKPVDISARSEKKPSPAQSATTKPPEDEKKVTTKQDKQTPEQSKSEIAARQDKTVAETQPPAEIPVKAKPKTQAFAQEILEITKLKVTDKTPAAPEETVLSGGTRLVIYDLESPESIKTVALILTEIIREELFRLKHFTLVNRETLQQILGEMALQQTGLIDEKQAVKAGKGLAASQVVTGKLGMLGKTYILQAKRIDVETFATLGFASTRFVQGQEEDVLSKLPALAKSLAGLQQ